MEIKCDKKIPNLVIECGVEESIKFLPKACKEKKVFFHCVVVELGPDVFVNDALFPKQSANYSNNDISMEDFDDTHLERNFIGMYNPNKSISHEENINSIKKIASDTYEMLYGVSIKSDGDVCYFASDMLLGIDFIHLDVEIDYDDTFVCFKELIDETVSNYVYTNNYSYGGTNGYNYGNANNSNVTTYNHGYVNNIKKNLPYVESKLEKDNPEINELMGVAK